MIEQAWQPLRRFTIRVDFIHISLLIAILLALVADFWPNSYDEDMDHEIYFGQRLLLGELIWTKEYHDKLFVVQLLHAIPAYFESILVLRLMGLLSSLGAAWALWKLLPRCAGSELVWPCHASHLALVYLLSALLLPESISHISPMAGSFAMLAILILIVNGGLKRWFFLAAVFAAIAISIRPYLLLPVLLAPVWLVMRSDVDRKRGIPALRLVFGWVCAIGALGVILNAGVYFASGNMESLLAGLAMLAQKATDDSVVSVLRRQVAVLVSEGWLLISLSVLGAAWWVSAFNFFRNKIKSRAANIDFLFLGLFFPASMQLVIIPKHFWPHYLGFVLPFVVLAVWSFLIHVQNYLNREFFQGVLVGAMCFFTGAALFAGLRDARLAVLRRPDHTAHLETVFLAKFLSKQPNGQRSFLTPMIMYPHWKLHESRRGFPHAANVGQIAEYSWLSRLQVPDALDFPTTYEALCEKLRRDAPRFVAVLESEALFSCMSSSESGFDMAADLVVSHKQDRFVIFVRKGHWLDAE